MNRTTLTTLLAVTILAGCAAGPDFKRPDAPHADRYTAQPLNLERKNPRTASAQQAILGEQLDQAWWQLFQSDALNGVVKRALAQNRSIVAAGYTLAQAQELAAAQAGTLYPRVGMTAGVGREKYGAEFLGTSPKPPPFTYFAVGPTISYSLDYTGGGARSVEQQNALASYQRQQLKAAYLTVTGNAVLESLKIASLRAQIATVQTLLDEDRENLKLVHEAFDAGSVSRLDIVSADSQLATDTALVPPLRQELSLAQHALAIVLGQAPAEGTLPEFDLAQLTLPRRLPVSLPSELAHRRPDILAAEAELHAATAAVGVATSNLYPHLDLSASFSQQSTVIGQLFASGSSAWSLAGGFVAPVFDGGTLRAKRRAAVDAMQASAAKYQQTVLTAFGQVADSLQALDHDTEGLDAQTRAQQAACDNLDLTRKSYREGNIGVLQVLDAERRYQQASLAYVRIRAQRYMDTAQLFLALGGSGPEVDAHPGQGSRRSD
ncbi:RND transporter [Sulfuriferula plumbiphila]|uniref:RND transporter n=1 Tax=Sulfuriferula plumbiphila TaxID=171865 RepID=A0A512L698_9PROT|nr:efflux transporter outer membrane subunit [Sulfuriferula plumbiphila]BBP03586.1 RND transporter [Sulfuriferula plumbiphila]GEP29987.1 RND transporter [Sulfuriferula plumbiphila]